MIYKTNKLVYILRFSFRLEQVFNILFLTQSSILVFFTNTILIQKKFKHKTLFKLKQKLQIDPNLKLIQFI